MNDSVGADGLAQQRAQDVVLGLEVVVQRRLPDADRLGDGPGRGARVAQRGEQFACGVEDLVARGDAGTPLVVQAGASGPGERHGPIVDHERPKSVMSLSFCHTTETRDTHRLPTPSIGYASDTHRASRGRENCQLTGQRHTDVPLPRRPRHSGSVSMGIAVSEVATRQRRASLRCPPIADPVATVDDLHVTFRRNGRDVHALRGVSLAIAPGEILGLVGESGSGKSVLGFTLLGLLPKPRAGRRHRPRRRIRTWSTATPRRCARSAASTSARCSRIR